MGGFDCAENLTCAKWVRLSTCVEHGFVYTTARVCRSNGAKQKVTADLVF